MKNRPVSNRRRSWIVVPLIVASWVSISFPAGAFGTDDPCFSILLRDIGNTGSLLDQDCKSLVCVALLTFGTSTGCWAQVNPEGDSLHIQVLWMPVVVGDWTLLVQGLPPDSKEWRTCSWSGNGLVGIEPLSLSPCNMEGPGPWQVRAEFAIRPVNVKDPSTYRAGTVGIYFGSGPMDLSLAG